MKAITARKFGINILILKKQRLIMWSLALPLFENEFTRLPENGSDTLERMFEIKRIDILR